MKVLISDLLVSAKQQFVYCHEFEKKSCEINGREVRFDTFPIMSCKIQKENNGELYADINVHLDTVLTCVKCLDEMKVTEDVRVCGILSKEDRYVEYDLILVDDYIDFDKILEDILFEYLSEHLYCSTDCKGLCPICGQNLNKSLCDCEQENPDMDPRLAALKDFF